MHVCQPKVIDAVLYMMEVAGVLLQGTSAELMELSGLQCYRQIFALLPLL